VKKVLLLVIVSLCLSGIVWAQTVKLAYINTDKVISECNDTKTIQSVFKEQRDGWEAQIKALDDAAKLMESDFDKKKLTMTENGKKEALAKIDAKKKERDAAIDNFFGENGIAKQRYQELIDPVTKKINSIIEKIAVDENYSMILDVSTGVVLYAKQNMDITDQVVTEMNKGTTPSGEKLTTPPATQTPVTPPPATDSQKTDKKNKKK
jgi:Skp family chaperone for outer membrane proteins